jgi:PadR family transcriptional regulator, regulatory protein PadR
MFSSDIIRGHLDAIILRLIIEKDRYGYEISKEIARRTNDVFEIKEATLYAVFQRLEKKRLIRSYYGDETQGGRRKYYKATSLGHSYFEERTKEWQKVKKMIDIFMMESLNIDNSQ